MSGVDAAKVKERLAEWKEMDNISLAAAARTAVPELLALISSLEGERDEANVTIAALRAENTKLGRDLQAAAARIAVLEGDRDRLRKALVLYGEHGPACLFGIGRQPCDCGFADALSSLSPETGKPSTEQVKPERGGDAREIVARALRDAQRARSSLEGRIERLKETLTWLRDHAPFDEAETVTEIINASLSPETGKPSTEQVKPERGEWDGAIPKAAPGAGDGPASRSGPQSAPSSAGGEDRARIITHLRSKKWAIANEAGQIVDDPVPFQAANLIEQDGLRPPPASDRKATAEEGAVFGDLTTHGRNCPVGDRPTVDFDPDCNCSLGYRRRWATAETMSAAWRKRAMEAEAALAVRSAT